MVAFVLVGFHADIYSFQRSSTFGIVVVGAYRSGVLLCKQFQPIGSGNWGGYQHSVDDRGAVLGGIACSSLPEQGFPLLGVMSMSLISGCALIWVMFVSRLSQLFRDNLH